MALRNFLTVLRRRFRLIVAVFLVCVAGTAVACATATRSYTATAALYVSVRTAASVDDLAQGASYSQSQMASFATIAATPEVLRPVADALGVPGGAGALGDQVTVSVLTGTTVLEVTVRDTDPRRAAGIADAVAAQTATTVEALAPQNPDGGRSGVKATVVTPAAVPTSAASPNTTLDMTAAAVLGLGLAVLAAQAQEALDTRVRGATELARVTSRPLLGTLGAESGRRTGVVMAHAPHSPQAEAYRQLRTSLQFLDVAGSLPQGAGTGKRLQVIAVSSAVAGEGKSTAAINLAVALAETSARVLLVDADLRRPTVGKVLGLEAAAGLTTVLLGRAELADVVQDWGTAGLQVLASGPLPPNPSELLGSPAMRRLVGSVREDYDYVVIDSAPLLPVADAAVLARLVDGTVVVANVTRVRQQQLAAALRTLERVEATVLGVVLNQVQLAERTYGYRPDGPTGTPPPAPVPTGGSAAAAPALRAR